MALPEGGEADYRRPWRLPKGEWAGTFMRRRRSLDAVRAVVLLLLLALGCLHHVETPALPAEKWFPLGRSELAPWSQRQRDSWRDAMLAQDTFAMDTALDRQGRVWVATLEPDVDGARLRIRVRDGDAWTVLPDVRLPSIRDGVVSLTTDAADRPVVAWLLCHAESNERCALTDGWSRWTGEGWTGARLPEIPEESDGPVGVVVVDDRVLVYRWLSDWLHGGNRVAEIDVSVGRWIEHPVPHGWLRTTPSVGGRREWAVLTTESDTIIWAGPDPVEAPSPEVREVESEYDDQGAPLPTPVPRGPALLVDQAGKWGWIAARGPGWNAAAAAWGDGSWLLDGYPHLVGTHYENEVNRLAVWRRDASAWTPLTATPLPTDLLYFEDIRLLPTSAPTLVLKGKRGQVDVVHWNGRDWWGLDGEPSRGSRRSGQGRTLQPTGRASPAGSGYRTQMHCWAPFLLLIPQLLAGCDSLFGCGMGDTSELSEDWLVTAADWAAEPDTGSSCETVCLEQFMAERRGEGCYLTGAGAGCGGNLIRVSACSATEPDSENSRSLHCEFVITDASACV